MKTFLFKCFLLILLVGNVSALWAQQDNGARAQRIYEWLVANEADSIHAVLNQSLQAQLSPVAFKDMLPQVERQFGKLQNAGDWHTGDAGGYHLHYRDLQFERYTLRLLLSFDEDGRLNTIRLMPAPAPAAATPLTYDSTKVKERALTVEVDGFRLPATLTLPKEAAGEVPCVVLVHGSGPNDRDETVGPNKPFRDLAWGLAARGIATLRYDKRTRVYGADCVPQDRVLDYDTEAVDDAVAALVLAGSCPEVASDSVYALGHSLGGTLAPRIAGRMLSLGGVIILAGLARPLEDAYVEQIAYLASLAGNSSDENVRKQLAEVRMQAENVKLLDTDSFDSDIPLPLNLPETYWRLANAYNPVEMAARLSVPILVLQGERDYQVTMEDFALWRAGLLHHRNASFKSYPKLNHLLQEGTGKSTPLEYEQASPVPTYVMDDIAQFIRCGQL